MVPMVMLWNQLLGHYLLTLMVLVWHEVGCVIVVALDEALEGGRERRSRWVVSIDSIVQ